LAFLSVLGVGTYYKLWERIVIFATRPVFGKNWANEVEKQKTLYPHQHFGIIFLGDSHMEQCEWHELFPDRKVANRGIGGETTEGLLARISDVPNGDWVLLQIGINDLLRGSKADEVFLRYVQVLEALKKRYPHILPTLVFYVRYVPEANPEVTRLNEKLKTLFAKEKMSYIDLNPIISENETLRKAYSSDGIHLNAQGYQAWKEAIRKLVFSDGQAFGSR
jgi:lysophospholipase L1-like esterase